MVKPRIPAVVEVMRIKNFDCSWIAAFSNDKRAIKIDIVNPIPASIARPKIWLQADPFGKAPHRNLTTIQEVSVIPIGFPKSRPRIIPKPRSLLKPPIIPSVNRIFVLASAKIGMIKKFTGLAKACSSVSKGEIFSSFVVGMVRAVKTPAMVA